MFLKFCGIYFLVSRKILVRMVSKSVSRYGDELLFLRTEDRATAKEAASARGTHQVIFYRLFHFLATAKGFFFFNHLFITLFSSADSLAAASTASPTNALLRTVPSIMCTALVTDSATKPVALALSVASVNRARYAL
jgi:hypothetical protein